MNLKSKRFSIHFFTQYKGDCNNVLDLEHSACNTSPAVAICLFCANFRTVMLTEADKYALQCIYVQYTCIKLKINKL